MRKVLLLMLLLALALSACSTEVSQDSTETDVEAADPACSTGVTMSPVDIDDAIIRGPVGYVNAYARAYIVRANQGCSLPTQYCIFLKYSDGIGLSCTTISP